jgi:cellulose synthase/poly-beta-1,6-N-acetylglucosamine synthase-like glycosyltransferase
MVMSVALIVLMISAALALYTLIGYPILLAIIPADRRPSGKDLRHQPTVSLIMVVYNGARHIRAKIEAILALDYPKQQFEIIVVSDGSLDETESIVREYANRGVQLIVTPHQGKSAGLNAALERASGEILFFTDVRQPLDRMAVRHLAANFADPAVGAVTGELRLMRGTEGEQADMDLYWRYELWARRRHSNIDSIFNTTGCVYAMRRELASPVPPDTLSDDAILPLRAFLAGYRVIFDPAAIAIDYPAMEGSEFRRRFRNLAGLWQIFVRVPQLFSSRNRMRFHFLSHKFSRLMLPWALLVALLATLALPASPLRFILLATTALILLLAALDRLIPKGFPLKRFSSPARTFLVMNIASLAAPIVFFVPPARLWVPTRVEPAQPKSPLENRETGQRRL